MSQAAARRSGLWLALALVVIAGLVRAIYFADVVRHDPFYQILSLGTDMRAYHDWAVGIAGGDWLSRSAGGGTPFDDWVSGTDGVLTRAPLYAYFLAGLYRLFGPGSGVVYAVQQLLGIGTSLLLLQLGRRLFSLRVGFVAGLFWAFYSVGMIYEMKQLLATLLTFLVVASALLIARAERSARARAWALAALPVGGAVLARPNLLLLAVLLLPWEILRRRGTARWRQAARGPLLLLGLVLLLILPVTLRNLAVAGEWVLISDNGGLNFFIGNNPQATGGFALPPLYGDLVERYARTAGSGEVPWFQETLTRILEHPQIWLKLIAKKALLFWHWNEIPNNVHPDLVRRYSPLLRLPWISYAWISVLGLLGLGLSRKRWSSLGSLYLPILTLWVSVTFFFVVARFRLPAVALICVFAAYGVLWLLDRLRAREIRRPARAAVLLAPVFLVQLLPPPGRTEEDRRMWAGNYVRSLARAGRFAEAIEEGETARKLGTLDASSYAVLCTAYYNEGDLDRAAEAIVIALRIDPTARTVVATWNDFRERIARRPDAVLLLRRWAQRHPDSPEVRSELERLSAPVSR